MHAEFRKRGQVFRSPHRLIPIDKPSSFNVLKDLNAPVSQRNLTCQATNTLPIVQLESVPVIKSPYHTPFHLHQCLLSPGHRSEQVPIRKDH